MIPFNGLKEAVADAAGYNVQLPLHEAPKGGVVRDCNLVCISCENSCENGVFSLHSQGPVLGGPTHTLHISCTAHSTCPVLISGVVSGQIPCDDCGVAPTLCAAPRAPETTTAMPARRRSRQPQGQGPGAATAALRVPCCVPQGLGHFPLLNAASAGLTDHRAVLAGPVSQQSTLTPG